MLKKILVSAMVFASISAGVPSLNQSSVPIDVQFDCMEYANQFGKRGTPAWNAKYHECICTLTECS